MIPTIWHSGDEKTIKTIKRSVFNMVWGPGRGLTRWNTGDFQDSKTVYNTVMVDTWNCTYGKTHTITTKGEPNVNYEDLS